ncbi:MAG: hypothetical protein GC159_10295 [Phycisphaera sp.]|nr:hypothetical protein [Phycisphaera sp.]
MVRHIQHTGSNRLRPHDRPGDPLVSGGLSQWLWVTAKRGAATGEPIADVPTELLERARRDLTSDAVEADGLLDDIIDDVIDDLVDALRQVSPDDGI